MSSTQHISYEQFAEKFAEFLDTVRAEQTPIVVEYASGEKLLIKPYAPAEPAEDPRAAAAPVTDERARQQPPQEQPPQDQGLATDNISTDNISSVGAMYDIDPNSVTPG